MKDKFILEFETMPKGTAQQKRYDGRRGIYFKSKTLLETERIYRAKLLPHQPGHPSDAPIRLFIVLYFDKKSPKKLWGTYKTTRPDADNFCKALIDQMTQVGFWTDDSQIVDLRIKKYYAEKASIFIEWEEVFNE
jgi:Holliday junction resolvase RusA-like endonuclease